MQRSRNRCHSGVIATLRAGGVGILKTDTIYGIVASAQQRRAVERVYRLRGRAPHKPCVILIANRQQLLSPAPAYTDALLEASWPGQVSVILPVDESVPQWLHRGTHSLAYRLPADDELRSLLAVTGPLIAPSANPEGKLPAGSIAEAEQYFSDTVDFYVDSGNVESSVQPSRLLRVREDGTAERLR